MSKNAENIAKKQTQNYYVRNNFEVRPVTKKDKWCRFLTRFESKFNNEAPYGYLVTIPNYFDGMELELNGHIIKNCLCDEVLLLQIVQNEKNLDNTFYVIRLYSNNGISRCLNIRNLKKVRPIQYY